MTLNILAWPTPASNDLNPYVTLIYSEFKPPEANLIKFKFFSIYQSKIDVFHIQWPEAIFWIKRRYMIFSTLRAFYVLRTIKSVKKKGGLIALTLHNLEPHANLNWLQRTIWKSYKKKLLENIDLTVTLSDDALKYFRQKNPGLDNIKSVVIPHPHYRAAYPKPINFHNTRAKFFLPIDAYILGIIGTMRPSKKIPSAINSFKANAKINEILFIAGGCDAKHWLSIVEAAGNHPNIILQREVLSDRQLVDAVSACDVIILNQEGMLNSGTALMSLSLDRPLIAPGVGSLFDLQQEVGANWLALFAPPLDHNKLRKGIDEIKSLTRPAVAPLHAFDASRLSTKMLNAFKENYAGRQVLSE